MRLTSHCGKGLMLGWEEAYEATTIHHAARRRSGVADCGARAAGGDACDRLHPRNARKTGGKIGGKVTAKVTDSKPSAAAISPARPVRSRARRRGG